ncbi:MAG TPA: nuclear transport factor 2 family protein [Vicinamibacterales bacterium]|nr:nuclear transport factor 2 family protein [Vicinamibacterales bacterium]
MTTRLLVLVLAVATAPILSAQSAQDAVKATHETLVAAVKSGNLTLVQSLIHPQAVGFYRASVRLVELSANYRAADAIPDVLADLGQFVIVPHETSYRVIGGTAVVSMATSMQANAEAKKDRVKDRSTRSTYVYVAVDGNWKLLSWHTSDTPLVK